MNDIGWFKLVSETIVQVGALGILAFYFLRTQPGLLEKWLAVAENNTKALLSLRETVARVEESQARRDDMIKRVEDALEKAIEKLNDRKGQ